ncbi:MAG: hypothetical protein AAGB31_12395 [Bdellovibrio sp.]
MKNFNPCLSLIALAAFCFCISCATQPIGPERIDPATAKVTDQQKPEGIIEDAARLRGFTVFPESVRTTMTSVSKASGDTKKTYRDVQNLICNGNQPKLNGEFQIKVLPPQKAPKGTPLDKVTEAKKDFLFHARIYLKTRFFFTAASKPITRFSKMDKGVQVFEDHEYNPDYADYMSVGNDSENQYKLRGQQYNIPFSLSQNKKEVEDFYRSLPYLPLFRERRWIENIYAPDFHIDMLFLAVVSTNRSALLVPKAASFWEMGWDRYNGNPIPQSLNVSAVAESSDTLPVLRTDPLDTFYKHVPVMISEFGWKIKDQGVLYPMQVAFAEDLNFLMEHYTFTLSREALEKEMGIADPLSQQHYGPEYHSGKFQAHTAIDNRGFIWEQVLKNATSLKEAPQADGSTAFSLNLDMGLFCRYGTPASELQSE